jgi:hypothetical protein
VGAKSVSLHLENQPVILTQDAAHTHMEDTRKGRTGTGGGISPQMKRLQACGNEGRRGGDHSSGGRAEEEVLPAWRGDVAMLVVPVAGGQDGDERA